MRTQIVQWISLVASRAASRAVLASFLALGLMSAAAWATDLSKYRSFQLGTDLATVAKQTGVNLSEAKVTHLRPALIQELAWRPQPLGPSSQTESAKDVVFSFYNGELYQISVSYDLYETEGMTTDDFVTAISTTYGTAARPTGPVTTTPGRYGDEDQVVARWEDQQYSFELIRSSYGPTFRLVGVLKKLEAPAQAAILEAARLDNQEAPQRDAARIQSEKETEQVKLEKARLANKPKFRP